MIDEALSSHNVKNISNYSLNAVEKDIEKANDSQLDKATSEEIEQLLNADYVYLSVSGDVYSSKRGYLGKASVYSDNQESLKFNSNQAQTFTPMSQSNPTVNEVNGGASGVFERKQLGFSGFDGITGNITLPSISSLGTGEQPWVYYGFDSSSGSAVEGGYSYQTGSKRWLPYIRSNGFYYADSAYQKYDGNAISNVKFYLKKASSSDSTYTAYLVTGGTQVKMTATTIKDTKVSAKRVTSIAKTGFTGSNITGTSMNQKFDSIQVSTFGSDYYNAWSNYNEYKEWNGSKWLGTIDNTTSYVHRNGNSVSLYR